MQPVVDLEPRVRIVGTLLGDWPSRRRGRSSDVVGSRPYVAGDDVRLIDWPASARATSLAAEERFVVRETFAEESLTVVIAVDRSHSMGLYPAHTPWLDKPAAVAQCVRMIVESAAVHRCLLSFVDSGSGRLGRAEPADSRRLPVLAPPDRPGEDEDWLWRRLADERRSLPPGTMVFLLSDFLEPPGTRLLAEALDAEWDLVPIVLSDPLWERSFPTEIGGLTVPLAVGDGRTRPLRLSRAEARVRRETNEQRFDRLQQMFRDARQPAVVLPSADPAAVVKAFLDWADRREVLW
jgi:uncharacterized protein (DUF58 family)